MVVGNNGDKWGLDGNISDQWSFVRNNGDQWLVLESWTIHKIHYEACFFLILIFLSAIDAGA